MAPATAPSDRGGVLSAVASILPRISKTGRAALWAPPPFILISVSTMVVHFLQESAEVVGLREVSVLGCQLPGSRASPPGPRGTTAQPQRGRPLVLQQRAEVVDGGRKCVPTCRLPWVSRCASMPPSPRGTAAQPRRTCPGSAAPVWVSPYTSRKKLRVSTLYILSTSPRARPQICSRPRLPDPPPPSTQQPFTLG